MMKVMGCGWIYFVFKVCHRRTAVEGREAFQDNGYPLSLLQFLDDPVEASLIVQDDELFLRIHTERGDAEIR